MSKESIVILGGGMAGMAAAYALARNGRSVTVVEAGPQLGGLAGSFHRDGHSFPLGYHHILYRDRHLLFFLDVIGALESVLWRRVRMLFCTGGRCYDLACVSDFLRFPMGLADKARFVGLMVRAFRKRNWTDWNGRSAQDLVDGWATAGVRRALFEPLTRIKFGLPCCEVSGAWLGARLHHREGSAPLGYIPGTNWTEVLCAGLAGRLSSLGVRLVTSARVAGFRTGGGVVSEVQTEAGDWIGGDVFVSTIPTEILIALLPEEDSPGIREVEYTALSSVICAAPKRRLPDFYWMNLLSPDRTASGLFMLDSLNPTIGERGESYVNFVTHTRSRTMPFFSQLPEDELCALTLADFREVFGEDLSPRWTQVNRLPMYSPVFLRDYRNPGLHSTRFRNLYFAGNFCTFPSVASTGTALHSGLEAARLLLNGGARQDDIAEAAQRFRPPPMRFD
ncbi:MAG: FAD-dependent oxidoreductase [Polyangia bacterium]|jgi:protoporphyrinogen oxidase